MFNSSHRLWVLFGSVEIYECKFPGFSNSILMHRALVVYKQTFVFLYLLCYGETFNKTGIIRKVFVDYVGQTTFELLSPKGFQCDILTNKTYVKAIRLCAELNKIIKPPSWYSNPSIVEEFTKLSSNRTHVEWRLINRNVLLRPGEKITYFMETNVSDPFTDRVCTWSRDLLLLPNRTLVGYTADESMPRFAGGYPDYPESDYTIIYE